VCLLDDEPSVLKALSRLLESEGISTEQFTDSEQFLRHAQSHPVYVAVLDVRMPGTSGFSVQHVLGTLHPRVQVIVITAEDDPAHRVAAMAGGASAFFLKPIDNDAFIAAIRAALRLADPLAG
jgi:FixJ family two-component response regulator